MGFPHSSVGKEFICNAGDPGWVPGSGRSPGEGIGYPLLYSWASLVAQLVKNLPAVWEIWVYLIWEICVIPGLGRSPGGGKGYPLQYYGLKNFMDYIGHGVAKSKTQLNDFHFQLVINQSSYLQHNFLSHKTQSLNISLFTPQFCTYWVPRWSRCYQQGGDTAVNTIVQNPLSIGLVIISVYHSEQQAWW